MPVTHHCGVPAAVKAGVGGRAATHHAGVSVEPIIRASSCRATERPSCMLRPCLRAPTAAGRAPGRKGAVHLAKTAFTTSSLAPWNPPPLCRTPLGRSQPPSVRMIPRFPAMFPRRPRGPRTGWQSEDVLFDPAVPVELPGGSNGPPGRPDRPHSPAGGDGKPLYAGPEQGRGTGDGCRLAPNLGPDSSGRPGPPGRRGTGTGPPTPDF